MRSHGKLILGVTASMASMAFCLVLTQHQWHQWQQQLPSPGNGSTTRHMAGPWRSLRCEGPALRICGPRPKRSAWSCAPGAHGKAGEVWSFLGFDPPFVLQPSFFSRTGSVFAGFSEAIFRILGGFCVPVREMLSNWFPSRESPSGSFPQNPARSLLSSSKSLDLGLFLLNLQDLWGATWLELSLSHFGAQPVFSH